MQMTHLPSLQPPRQWGLPISNWLIAVCKCYQEASWRTEENVTLINVMQEVTICYYRLSPQKKKQPQNLEESPKRNIIRGKESRENQRSEHHKKRNFENPYSKPYTGSQKRQKKTTTTHNSCVQESTWTPCHSHIVLGWLIFYTEEAVCFRYYPE